MMLLENLGRLVLEKRGAQGVRAVARQIGISHATLSRVEKGFHPDLENYQKICRWLGLDTSTMKPVITAEVPQVHFRRGATVSKQTAKSLANMILAAQSAWPNSE